MREIVPFTNDVKRIESGLGQIEHGEATALYDAMYLASERLRETTAGGRAAAGDGADYRWREHDASWQL